MPTSSTTPAPQPITPDRLAEIRDREARATAGPWQCLPLGTERLLIGSDAAGTIAEIDALDYRREGVEGADDWDEDAAREQMAANGRFLAAARGDVRYLLAEIDRLQARVAELQAAAGRPREVVMPEPGPSPDEVVRAAAQIAAAGDPCVKHISTLTDVIDLHLRPRTLADWNRWLKRLHVDCALVTNRGAVSTAKGRWGDVHVALTGEGVGALHAAALRAQGGAR